MAFPSTVEIPYGSEMITHTTKRRPLGTRGVTPDGRVFYYAQNGTVALEANVLAQSRVGIGADSNSVALVPTTIGGGSDNTTAGGVATGSDDIGVVVQSSYSSGEYVDGYLVVETTPGFGFYRIIDDTGATATGLSVNIKLHPNDPLQGQALTTVSRIGLRASPYSRVIVAPASTPTSMLAGVSPIDVGASAFFWCQTYGPAIVVYDALVAAVAGNALLGGVSASAGNITGFPVSTDTTTGAITSTAGVVAYSADQRIGIALSGIPDDGDSIYCMLTIRA